MNYYIADTHFMHKNTFNAFGAATWLPESDWFLHAIETWRVFEGGEWEDCLATPYKYAEINERHYNERH